MRTVIFSDTHLTHKFEPGKFGFLKRIIENSDRVVINGDFWDGWLTSWDKFIQSGWKELFPMLLDKRAVYVFGNHDPQMWSDGRRERFCRKWGNSYEFESEKLKIGVRHG